MIPLLIPAKSVSSRDNNPIQEENGQQLCTQKQTNTTLVRYEQLEIYSDNQAHISNLLQDSASANFPPYFSPFHPRMPSTRTIPFSLNSSVRHIRSISSSFPSIVTSFFVPSSLSASFTRTSSTRSPDRQ